MTEREREMGSQLSEGGVPTGTNWAIALEAKLTTKVLKAMDNSSVQVSSLNDLDKKSH